jgi:hypothetical protein
VFERELAFEARIEALAGKDKPPAKGYSPRHARAALDRHVAETLLAALPIQPAPTEAELTKRTARARQKLSDRVGGQAELDKAAAAEGITAGEVDELLRRQAKASFYLDRMVAPMLTPSEAELREALARQQTPFAGEPFERVAGELATWLLGERLKQAVDAYLQSARARVQVTLIGG